MKLASLLIAALPLAALDADLIIVNGRVRTMNSRQPSGEAISVAGERIVAVGSNAEVRRSAGPRTRVIDAKGRLVLPGFNDAHVHFLSGGFQLSNVDLRSADSPREFAQRLARFAAGKSKGEWILGGDWDHERWPGTPLPARSWIDPVAPDHPVWVQRLDGHMGVANGVALKLAGITRDTPDPPGGLIVRDPGSGEPTGVLKDAAMSLVNRIVPEPSFTQKLAAARSATGYAASLGVTSVQDMSAGSDVSVYQALLRRGELKTRIYAMAPLRSWERLAGTGVLAGFGSAMLRIGGLKGFSDGSLGSTTAWFFEPYDDTPSTSGLASDEMYPDGAMASRVREADRAGLQVMVHAIGDRANDASLSMFASAAQANGPRDRRFRIEHAQHLRPRDIARFGAGRVIASMQPYHCIDDGRWAEKRIGTERAKGTYAFRSLLDSGAALAFGSDWTVAPLNPLLGIYAAVTRRTLDGKHPEGWIPEQKISVEEAVRAYTLGSAHGEFTEGEKGTLAPGKLADLVILSDDLFGVEPETIRKVTVVMTVMNGRVVFERGQ